MVEENTNIQEEVEKTPEEIILELKKNTVSKEEFEKLKSKHNKLLKDIADGKDIEQEEVQLTEEEREKRIKDLRVNLYTDKASLNNLDYWKQTLELRKLLMESGEPDPMVARGKMFNDRAVNQEEEVLKVVETVQKCIDDCNGSSKVFTSLLQDIMIDDPNVTMKLARERAKRR